MRNAPIESSRPIASRYSAAAFLNESSNSNQHNIQLPEWFSDKLITDFFKYEDDALAQNWVEKGLAVNETALAFYNAEIKAILDLPQYEDLVNDYKMLAGNVFNFETIFRDNNWNYEMNNDFQAKHQNIIAKYREIYSSNLNKWKEAFALLQNSYSHERNSVTPWITKLGVQNTFISAAFLSMGTSLVFLIMILWGKKFREMSKERYWGYVAKGKALGLSH